MYSGAVSSWQWLPYLTNFQCEAMSAISYQVKIQSVHLIKYSSTLPSACKDMVRQLFGGTRQWVCVICVLVFIPFQKNLSSVCQLSLFYSLALKIWDAALEHFHPVVLFFVKSDVACYFMNSECVCVNAYSALMGLFMTILLKHLGVHYGP